MLAGFVYQNHVAKNTGARVLINPRVPNVKNTTKNILTFVGNDLIPSKNFFIIHFFNP